MNLAPRLGVWLPQVGHMSYKWPTVPKHLSFVRWFTTVKSLRLPRSKKMKMNVDKVQNDAMVHWKILLCNSVLSAVNSLLQTDSGFVCCWVWAGGQCYSVSYFYIIQDSCTSYKWLGSFLWILINRILSLYLIFSPKLQSCTTVVLSGCHSLAMPSDGASSSHSRLTKLLICKNNLQGSLSHCPSSLGLGNMAFLGSEPKPFIVDSLSLCGVLGVYHLVQCWFTLAGVGKI